MLAVDYHGVTQSGSITVYKPLRSTSEYNNYLTTLTERQQYAPYISL